MEALRAHVRPRVIVNGRGAARSLDSVLPDLISARRIAIVGERGSGRTTALSHLRSLLVDEPSARWLDDAASGDVETLPHHCLVAYSGPVVLDIPRTVKLELAPWGDDELIEFILSAARDRARDIIPRLLGSESRATLGGSPCVWTPVLLRMIRNHSTNDAASDPVTVFQSILDEARSDPKSRKHTRHAASLVLKTPRRSPGGRLPAFFLQRPVQLAIASFFLAQSLATHKPLRMPADAPDDVLRACAAAVAGIPAAIENLRSVLESRRSAEHSAAASLLHAAGLLTTPPQNASLNLSGARLSGLSWPRVHLKLKAERADLSNANFENARLIAAAFAGAAMPAARLSSAVLASANLSSVRLVRADLSFATLDNAACPFADLTDAQMEGISAVHANFMNTIFTGARLVRARLARSSFHSCDFDAADLSGACLDRSELGRVDLRACELVGASFQEARLFQCTLAGLHMPAADFRKATFHDVDLTATSMPNACFARATFRACGLADIDWERADLRNADLDGCTFHMGSSRSGLVFSPIASEGSRTGFYTDDFDAHTHKAPEEVRKANLRGADLRGANVGGVDFYLVDLRDAQYDPAAADWFRKCGAILFDRA